MSHQNQDCNSYHCMHASINHASHKGFIALCKGCVSTQTARLTFSLLKFCMRNFSRNRFLEIFIFICSFCVVLRVVTAPMSAKEYTLVWWIEDDTVGVMPLSAVNNESRPCKGDIVDMRWRGKKPTNLKSSRFLVSECN